MSAPLPTLILGSGSPRRRDILKQLGVPFTVVTSDLPEPPPQGQAPETYARELAELKAREVAGRPEARQAAFVLGADTIVVLGPRILGKPLDDDDAVAMLSALSGTTHEVVTAVSLVSPTEGVFETLAVHTEVVFRSLAEASLRRYVASGEGRDKAGSYAVQGLGAGLVQRIEGSYSNVVGLPACETLELLMRAGVVEAWP